MMERLRAGADSLVVKVILGLIILSFVFAGVGSYLIGGSDKPIAVIGSVEISESQFEQAYQNERQSMQEQAGEMFNTLIANPSYLAQFRANVLDRMINQSLLDQYATQLGLRVSDELIKDEIRSMPAFWSNGIFNNEQYLASLRRNGLTPEQFAEFVRQDLSREQLIAAIQGSEFTLNNELASLYKLEEQSRRVRSLTLELNKFAEEIKPTDEEKQAYYQENAMQFMRPEQLKISYIELSGKKLAESVTVSEAEANDYYQANLARFGTAEQRKVSHIMLEGDSDEQMKKAEALLKELQAGADFAELAKANSQDTFSAEQGGQLDWFEKGVMDPSFEAAAFGLKNTGDIATEVVKSDFGLHIIKLDDIKASDITPFAEVKQEILTQLKQQKAAESFYSLSSKLAEKAFEMPDNLDEAANAVNMDAMSTDFVSIAELSEPLLNPLVQQALQQDDVRDGLNSEVIELAPEHAVVVRIDEIRPETILPFAEVEKQVTARLQQEKGELLMQALADKLVEELNNGQNAALQASGYRFSEAQDIKRNDAQNRDLVDLAFTMSLSDGKPEYGAIKTFDGNMLILELEAITEPKPEDADLQGLMAERVQQSLANASLISLIEQLKQEIKVTSDLSAFNTAE